MPSLAILLFLLFLSQSSEASTAPAQQPPPPTPKPPAKPPASPAPAPATPLAPMPPWPKPTPVIARPQASAKPKPVSTSPAPAGLPKFPAGWEPDTPPSAAVVARAYALLPTLWKSGKPGAIATEQTEGQWKTYQAYSPAKGKRSVVAYRLKAGGGGTVFS